MVGLRYQRKLRDTREASNGGRLRVCIIHGLNISNKELTYFVGETDPRTPMGLADRAPFGSAGGGDRTKSRSRRSTRAVYPASELSGEIILLLLHV